MARQWLRRHLPGPELLEQNRWLRQHAPRLAHPALWHLNRRSVSGGIAVGLFCGLIPGPLQMLGAALAALVLRVNLPLALATTLYTNPVTILPLYWLAFQIGALLTGGDGQAQFLATPTLPIWPLWPWMQSWSGWLLGLGLPLAVGLPCLAVLLALFGYGATRFAWRVYLVRRWQHRRRSRDNS